MNNDLTQEADPQEVIKELKSAYQQVYEDNKRLRADIMFLENGKAELQAEEDVYRKALEKIMTAESTPYLPEGQSKWRRILTITGNIAAEALGQYPSPSKDKDNG